MRPFARRILAIDDLADREHECDVLLDQNVVSGSDTRYKGLVGPAVNTLLGPQFALLHEDYRVARSRVRPRDGEIRRVLVSFGGVDANNLTGKAIDALTPLVRRGVSVDVVVGASAAHAEAIRSQVQRSEGFHFHSNLPSLAHLMGTSDLAIGAAGTTVWEMCALGVPAIVMAVAQNQEPGAKELGRLGYIYYLGRSDNVTDADLKAALLSVIDSDFPKVSSRKCMALVDGLGATRVTRELLGRRDIVLNLRPATLSDESVLLRWANDPEVRRNAFNDARISSETHAKWFRSRLANWSSCRIYIAEDMSGDLVGQIRFEITPDGWQLGYSVDGSFRGRGVGSELIEKGCMALGTTVGDCDVFGLVLAHNEASIRSFLRLGFSRSAVKQGVDIYRARVSSGRVVG